MKIGVLLIFTASILFAQNKQIINSGQYYFGSGTSFDVREARDWALDELTEQIAVRVAKSFEREICDPAKDLDDDVKSILRTHSSATLKNIKSIKTPASDGQVEVFCYLSKQKVIKRVYVE
ncbi:MAG: hypothetical protein K8R79_07110 [Calditrichales bacterium]|nr:hypothetical protein [Calditrichales bacterium]